MAAAKQQSLHLEHRARPSRFYPGDFAVDWVGKNPTIEERRWYMNAYLNWIVPASLVVGQKTGEFEGELRQRAERFVAARHVAEGTARMREAIFQYKVDYVYWDQWLSNMAPNAPVWPWSMPAEDPRDKWSATFATLTRDNEVKALAKEWQESQGKKVPLKAGPVSANTTSSAPSSASASQAAQVPGPNPPRAPSGPAGTPSRAAQGRGRPTGQAPAAAPGGNKSGNKPGNKKKLQVKPKAPRFVEANKPEPLEASIANQEKPSFAATVGTSPVSKLGPPKGIEDSIWAPSGSASKAAAKPRASKPQPAAQQVKPVAPRPQPVPPRPQPVPPRPQPAAQNARPGTQRAVATKPKDVFCLSEMAKALPPVNFGLDQLEPVYGFRHGGRFYPEPPSQPDRAHREKAWRLALPGLPLPVVGEPFRIELSEQMDFGFLVWGLNGAHWKYIQEHLVDPSLNLSWGYKDPIPQKAAAVLYPGPVSNVAVARVLDLGLVNNQFTGNLERLKDLWSSLSLWSQVVRSGHTIPLHEFLDRQKQEAGKGLAMKGAGDLVPGYMAIEQSKAKERDECISAIKGILDVYTDAESTALRLEQWVLAREQGKTMKMDDRCRLVSLVWRMQNPTPETVTFVNVWEAHMLGNFKNP